MTTYSTITTTYTYTITGSGNPTSVAAAMAAVPLNQDPLLLGLRLTSDVTQQVGSTAVVTRTLIFSMNPASAATITAAVNTTKGGQNRTGEISTLTVTGNGLDYIRPPVLSFTDSASKLASGAAANAKMGVYGVNCSLYASSGGANYTAPVVTASGGELAPGGTQATFGTPVLAGGVISSVPVVTTGGPYNAPPTLTVTDSTGSGASLLAQLGITGTNLVQKGTQYETPSVVITPFYLVMFPQGSPQQSPIQGFMKNTLELALNALVTADVPQLS